ncbi:MAG: signal peptidase II [Clostridium sp.]|nr:MAG: signal peptidase II [Clostridium sp.]
MKKNIDNNLSLLSFSLILGGAIGNLIDRIFRGHVIDYISFTLFKKGNVYI